MRGAAMKTKDTPKQYVIYSRKSKFTGKGESIENQIELCRQYIAMHFGEEAAENVLVYEDEGFSGGNLERPQFKKMMKHSQKIEFAAIVVYRLDRISRNIGDFAKLIEDLGDRHTDFISIREQFDTSSSAQCCSDVCPDSKKVHQTIFPDFRAKSSPQPCRWYAASNNFQPFVILRHSSLRLFNKQNRVIFRNANSIQIVIQALSCFRNASVCQKGQEVFP